MSTHEERDMLNRLFGDLLSDLESDDDGRAKEPGPITRPGSSNRRPVPRVGTSIQRGDAETRRRAQFLATPPPPRKPRARQQRPPPAVTRRRAPASTDRREPPPGNADPRTTLANAAATPPAPRKSFARRLFPPEPTATTTAPRAPSQAAPAPPRHPAPARPPAAPRATAGATTCCAVTRPEATCRPPPARADLGATHQPPPSRAAPTPVAPRLEPVIVSLPSAEVVVVPYTAAFRNRKYRANTTEGRWLLRFDHQGRLRSTRKLPDRPTEE
ncbi:PREDICTED: lysine-rich arabinogalactan protein 19-like [Wasmannia auropunctata]|uniref:lysine-rich arabinogalactan protein 19-like n=1 Tax=Wasmannia auropunctata TaxID=64793 RepID=UPI0005EE31ED|nr:PREDICTED: lysine-rich arabinogalactan protein 19-like [Wasmannia auropunctata]